MSLWDRVKSGVSKAASEAEKQATVARLSMQVGDERIELRKKTAELGEAALELCRSGELKHESVAAIYDQIRAVEEKIADLESQIAKTREGEGEDS